MFHNPGRVSTNLTHKQMDKTILCLLHDGNKVVPCYLNLSKNISKKSCIRETRLKRLKLVENGEKIVENDATTEGHRNLETVKIHT